MSYDAAAVRVRLDDPVAVAEALDLIDGRGSYKRLSRGILVRCPAHAERTPSCSLAGTGDGVVWHCFGCNAGGDVFGLVAAVAGLDTRHDFPRVLELAAALAGVEPGVTPPTFVPPPRPPEPERLDDDTFDAIAQTIATRGPVTGDADVAGYLAARGFERADVVGLAALPADRAGQLALVEAIVATVGRDAWERSGLASAGGGFVFPAHRLVAFWRGQGVAGLAQTIQRRVVRAGAEGRVGRYVFATRRPPRWPYGVEHAEELGPGGVVAFCEGFLDALALRALWAREGTDGLALGLPGVAGWVQAWARLAAGRVALVATDPDAAGEAAAGRIGADLRAAGVCDARRYLPDGADDWTDLLARRAGAVAA